MDGKKYDAGFQESIGPRLGRFPKRLLAGLLFPLLPLVLGGCDLGGIGMAYGVMRSDMYERKMQRQARGERLFQFKLYRGETGGKSDGKRIAAANGDCGVAP